jgi:hypothetical protein
MYYEKKVYKQWWSTIPSISTKQTVTSHLSSLNTKKTTTYDDVNPGSDLGQAQTCGGVKQVNGILTLPSWFLLITGSPSTIHIETSDKKTCIDSLPLKKITKVNNIMNINMDSTIEGWIKVYAWIYNLYL